MLLSEVSEQEQEIYRTGDNRPVSKGTIKGVIAAFSNFGEQIGAFALEPVITPMKKESEDVV